jgi:arginine/lysine/ornithine decarboxylase
MLSSENDARDPDMLADALCAIPRREPITKKAPAFSLPTRVLSPREAVFAPNESISLDKAEGRILALATVGCPPAVPLAVCGERLDRAVLDAMFYYGIRECVVVRE